MAARHQGKGKRPMTSHDPINITKRLPFHIINVQTGLVERHDPRKHSLDPSKHHPENAQILQEELLKKTRQKLYSPSKLNVKQRSLKTQLEAADYISKPGRAIIDEQEKYVYAHNSIVDNETLDWHMRTLEKDKDGALKLQLSKKESNDMAASRTNYKEYLQMLHRSKAHSQLLGRSKVTDRKRYADYKYHPTQKDGYYPMGERIYKAEKESTRRKIEVELQERRRQALQQWQDWQETAIRGRAHQ